MRVLLVASYELGHQPLQRRGAGRGAPRAGATRSGALDLSVDPWDPTRRPRGPTGSRSRCRCTPPPASPAPRSRPSGRTGPTSRSAATASTRRCAADVADRVLAGETTTALVDWVEGRADRAPPWCASAARPRRRARRSRRATSSRRSTATRTSSPASTATSASSSGTSRRATAARTGAGTARSRSSTTVASASSTSTPWSPTSRSRSTPAPATSPSAIPTSSTACTTRCGSCGRCTRGSPTSRSTARSRSSTSCAHAERLARARGGGVPVRRVGVRVGRTTRILARLDKGHTAADAARGRRAAARHGIEVRPSFLPFTPWTTARRRPRAARLRRRARPRRQRRPGAVHDPAAGPAGLAAPRASRRGRHGRAVRRRSGAATSGRPPTRRSTSCSARLAAIVEEHVAARRADSPRPTPPCAPRPARRVPDPLPGARSADPRLTEPWFCCAEPTAAADHAHDERNTLSAEPAWNHAMCSSRHRVRRLDARRSTRRSGAGPP